MSTKIVQATTAPEQEIQPKQVNNVLPHYNIEVIIVDTINTIQDVELHEEMSKPDRDTWRDYGIRLSNFITRLQKVGFDISFVLGTFGTGKSYGMKTLTPGSYIWFNADNKNPTWEITEEQKRLYGTIHNPGPLMVIPTAYQQITDRINSLITGVKLPTCTIKLAKNPIALILGHVEEYKGLHEQIYSRLRTLGKVPTKMQLEGRSANTFGAGVSIKGGKVQYVLRTTPSGFDTIRTVENLFEPIIPNDYAFIVSKIQERNNLINS